MNLKCIERLSESLFTSHPQSVKPEGFEIVFEQCPQGMTGDITVNCFKFARVFASSPDAIAQEVCDILANDPDVISAEKIKAFVNVTVKSGALFEASLADMPSFMASVSLPESERKRILVEYSAPNTNKPQHLGHVRNNTIGMSLVEIIRRAGHTPIPVNLVNDRGIHICKSMLAYKICGNNVTPEEAGVKGDHYVGDFYVKYNSMLSDEIKALKAEKPELADKANDELFLETNLGREAQAMLRKWEDGDIEVVELWEKMNSWVFAGFDETYKRMGIKFDKTYLESQTYLLGKETIAENLSKGVFTLRDDGATIVDLGKLGFKVLLRKDGTSVYITQDIGTTLLKHSEHNPDTMIWVVGDEQNLHFQMLFAILKKMGCDWADKLHHLSYGMVNLPTGKMKSREGTVVDADDLFDEMHALAKNAALERAGENDIPSDLEERSEIIGMGALKFMLLKFNPKTTIMFDPQASLRFEGDTGPYVQYVCARVNSIARKAAERGIKDLTADDVDWSLLDSSEEKALAVTAMRYIQTIRTAAEKMDSSILVNYLLDLAKAFNRFYREKQVLNAGDEKLLKSRLALCFAVRDILSDGLATLTIDIPEAM